jgi:tetraacyldisaccharide 4'-kinase
MEAARPTSSSSANFAARHWYRLGPVSVLLFPASLAFRLLVSLRRTLYRAGFLRSIRVPVPVIIVGNLTVGGTGKTPLVLWLAEILCRRGKHPGIVSRGFGARRRIPRQVIPGDDAAVVGDEPLLLAEKSGCPVWIGADRAGAARALIAANPECDVILSDDGLQHYGLARDFEIAVQDSRGLGNGLLLPAGPLREPPGRGVDATVANGATPPPGTFHMRLRPAGFYRLDSPGTDVPLKHLARQRLHAVAGIGNPERFFSELTQMGLDFTAHAFADHHAFRPHDLAFSDCDLVLMTEKDAVKCRGFGRRDLVALRVVAEVDPALVELIMDRIHGRAPA